jgi:hypothetical protein
VDQAPQGRVLSVGIIPALQGVGTLAQAVRSERERHARIAKRGWKRVPRMAVAEQSATVLDSASGVHRPWDERTTRR